MILERHVHKLVFHVSISDKKVPALIMKICNVISPAPE
ncbi:hypothetical protein NC651_021020 [Populus alba x Populus x berolinensis]|nr:hypothetical protein NC651_021020 [Populus alba x Populus x berolinensis]